MIEPAKPMPTTTPGTPEAPVLAAPSVVTSGLPLVVLLTSRRGSRRKVTAAEPDFTKLTEPPPLFSKRLRNWALPALAQT